MKPRAKTKADAAQALINDLADKPYGEEKDVMVTRTISLPKSLDDKLDYQAFMNKRNKQGLKSVSAIVVDVLNRHLD
jgi:hypothetical protein